MVFVLFALAPCCWLNIVCRQFLSPLPSHVLPFQYFDISFFFLSWRTLYLSIKICFLFLAFFYANLFLVLSSRIEFPNVSNFADQRGGGGEKRADGSAWAIGKHAHMQLHLPEWRAHTPATHANGMHLYVLYHCLRKWRCVCTYWLAVSAAWLQSLHGPLVHHGPQVRDSCSSILGYSIQFCIIWYKFLLSLLSK